MTAVSKEIKRRSKGRYRLKNTDIIKISLFFLAGVSGAGASWRDISLAFLPVALAPSIGQGIFRWPYLAGAGAGLLAAGINSEDHLACFISLAAYILLSDLLKRDKLGLAGAAVILSAIKLFFSLGSPLQARFFAVMEGAFLFFAAATIKEGADRLKKGYPVTSATDALEILAFFAAACLSLSGLDSHSLYPGAALALGISWYFARRLKADCCILCLLAGFICLWDKNAAVYAAGVYRVIWRTGCAAAEKSSLWIYPRCAAVALTGNIALLSQLGGFSLCAVCALALAAYLAAPAFLNEGGRVNRGAVYGQKDRRQLTDSLVKLQESLNFMGRCAIDISRLGDSRRPQLPAEDTVAGEICRRCERNTVCWQENYSFTRGQFARYRANRRSGFDFDRRFYRQCNKAEQIKKSFADNFRLEMTRRYISRSQKNNQALLQNAFMSIAEAVGDLACKSRTGSMVNYTLTAAMDTFLADNGIEHSYCLCTQNPDRMEFACYERLGGQELEKVKGRLADMYLRPFLPAVVCRQGVEYIYSFSPRPDYSYTYSARSSRLKSVSGDNYRLFCQNDKLYVILCDGMGTGSAAAAESRTACAMLKSLLSAGTRTDRAVNIVNLALNLKGGGENSVSADIRRIDLNSGTAQITKAGAGPSMIIYRQKTRPVYADSLPMGVVKDVKAQTFTADLSDGAPLVMMSDGVGRVGQSVCTLYAARCEKIADFVIEADRMKDDKTVIVLRLSR